MDDLSKSVISFLNTVGADPVAFKADGAPPAWKQLEERVRARVKSELGIELKPGVKLTREQTQAVRKIWAEELKAIRTVKVGTKNRPVRLRERRTLILPASTKIIVDGKEAVLSQRAMVVLLPNTIVMTPPPEPFVYMVSEEVKST